jgi:hypothetical protein
MRLWVCFNIIVCPICLGVGYEVWKRFFFRITQYIGDTHNAHTLIPMNTHTQTLPLGASLKTAPANPQDWRSRFETTIILLGATTICWSLWLCRNDIIFRNKHNHFLMQVIYSIIHLLCTWAILQKPTSQDLDVVASLHLVQVVKELFTLAHGWWSNLWIDCY